MWTDNLKKTQHIIGTIVHGSSIKYPGIEYQSTFSVLQKHVFWYNPKDSCTLESWKRACWSLWQARPCSWNVVYWNSTSLSKFIPHNFFPAHCVKPLTPGTIPRSSAITWTSIMIYTLKESGTLASCGFSDHWIYIPWDIYQPVMQWQHTGKQAI